MARRQAMTRTYIATLLLLVSSTVLRAQTLPCFPEKTIAEQCPDTGCAQANTPDAEANKARRNAALGSGEPLHLTVDDFEALQGEANKKGLQGFAVPLHQRRELYGKMKALAVKAPASGSRQGGEGSKVELHGYVVGIPH